MYKDIVVGLYGVEYVRRILWVKEYKEDDDDETSTIKKSITSGGTSNEVLRGSCKKSLFVVDMIEPLMAVSKLIGKWCEIKRILDEKIEGDQYKPFREA